MKLIKLQKNKKAISPIFATLILIAIAVIAGIVVYMFTSGALPGLTGPVGGTDKVAVQTVVANDLSADVSVWAKSTGGTTAAIDGAILKDSGGATLDVVTLDPAVELPSNSTLTEVKITFNNALDSETTYSVTLTSVGGGSFPSAAFKPAD